ncbi:beta-d-glucosyl crocetin beta-1 6-glucosyltransferase [Phtheirospermum japonicum]|uniref:Beta-d-glucosyl crocetin beta-1 6-glucosyltransferase n=1 Tax=Phtheirospermum japonicum TaxID=374723 RepID=A0A830BU74_9LAMI|nr:beta-d-glucosyl crocetin beta-1 6-glucosyltransferase [Phtheirospermum japonicum]
MFPWLGYGHIMPYLELAKKLTTRGDFKVYLCSTLATLGCIEHKITDKMSESINLVPILLPASPDLPRKLHTTNGLPPSLMSKLKDALQSSVSVFGFSNILSDLKPDLLIYDILQPWVPLVAKDMKIPAVQFITSSCTSISVMCHYFKNPSGDVEFPFPEIRFRDYESCEERELVFKGLEESSNIVLVKGFRDIEHKYIDYASALLGKKFVAVGPLVQEPSPDEKYDRESLDLLSWLDKKEPKSTVFVSFGSEYFLTKDDMAEIAHGLELCGVNFIWVVRFPKDYPNGLNGRLNKNLPEGFVERVGDRGRVLEGWAPQAKILGHENTGGIVSHCGWNSVLESMSLGVPVIALPMHLDQPINARLVGNVGVGVEVLRDGHGRLHGETLAAVIKHVVVEASGENVRNTAARMKEKLRSKGDDEMDDVSNEIISLFNKAGIKINGVY